MTNAANGGSGTRLKKGLRGRFAMYVPPLPEALGLAELGHDPRNDRTRAR